MNNKLIYNKDTSVATASDVESYKKSCGISSMLVFLIILPILVIYTCELIKSFVAIFI